MADNDTPTPDIELTLPGTGHVLISDLPGLTATVVALAQAIVEYVEVVPPENDE